MNEDKVRAVIDEMDSADVVDIWNEYCDKQNYFDDKYLYMDEFDDLFCGCTPLKIAEVVYQEDFNPRQDYFKEGVYGVTSYEDAWACVCDMDLDSLVDYIVENDEDFHNDDLREALDYEETEDEVQISDN